jgi:hypothetical protein
VEVLVLAIQFDPILSLELNRRRHAELIAEAQHEELVQAALEYSTALVASQVEANPRRLSRAGARQLAAFILTWVG